MISIIPTFFKHFGVPNRTGWRILAEPPTQNDRTFYSAYVETRGRKSKLSPNDIATIERLLESQGFYARTIPWAGLPTAAGLDIECSGEVVRRTLKDRNLRRCIACEKA